ncbi:hypothetical protein SRABI106_02089 [Rahnella aquatilis]|nr:hypothetical protein SRABI106_02089 [Rahnella aquatilis]
MCRRRADTFFRIEKTQQEHHHGNRRHDRHRAKIAVEFIASAHHFRQRHHQECGHRAAQRSEEEPIGLQGNTLGIIRRNDRAHRAIGNVNGGVHQHHHAISDAGVHHFTAQRQRFRHRVNQ